MLLRIAILWVLGLLTAVPYAVYRLLFIAARAPQQPSSGN